MSDADEGTIEGTLEADTMRGVPSDWRSAAGVLHSESSGEKPEETIRRIRDVYWNDPWAEER